MFLEIVYIMVKMNILALLRYNGKYEFSYIVTIQMVTNGNFEHPYIVTIKITSVTTVAKSFYFVIIQIVVTSNESRVTRVTSHES